MEKKWFERLKNSPFTYATIFSGVVFGVFMCTDPTLSAAGDRNISEYLMSGGRISVGNFFINPVLAKVLRILNSFVLANWWSVFSVAVTFSGIYVFLWFINKRIQKQHGLLKVFTSLVFIFFMWQIMIHHPVNFTHTATICGLAGFCIIADAVMSDDSRTKCVIKFVLGMLFMFLSGQIRLSSLKIVVAFALMSFAYVFVFPFSMKHIVRDITTALKEKKRILIAILIVLITMIGNVGVEKLYRVVFPAYDEYIIACVKRAAICDYSDRYLSYEDNAEVYEANGLTESWVEMAMGFVTSDMNFFSNEYKDRMIALQLSSQSKVENIAEIYCFADEITKLAEKEEQEFIRELLKEYSILEITDKINALVPTELQDEVFDVRESFFEQVILYIILLILLIMIVLLQGWKNAVLPMLGGLAGFIACNIYLFLGGRFPWRVISSCMLCAVIAFVVMSAHIISEKRRIEIKKTGNFLVILLMAIIVVGGAVLVKEQKGELSLPQAKVTNENRAEILDYMDANSNTVYLYMDSSKMRFTRNYNMWATHVPEYLDNTFPLIAEFILGCKNKLLEYGITDVYNNMLDYSNIRVAFSEECISYFYRYLKDYYDPCVTVSGVEEYKGKVFLRYSKQVLPTKTKKIKVTSYFKEKSRFEEYEDVVTSYLVRCRFDEEKMKNYCDYFINVTDNVTGEVYSYGMALDGKRIEAEILCMVDTWNPEYIQVQLVGKRMDGTVEVISDLTEKYERLE